MGGSLSAITYGDSLSLSEVYSDGMISVVADLEGSKATSSGVGTGTFRPQSYEIQNLSSSESLTTTGGEFSDGLEAHTLDGTITGGEIESSNGLAIKLQWTSFLAFMPYAQVGMTALKGGHTYEVSSSVSFDETFELSHSPVYSGGFTSLFYLGQLFSVFIDANYRYLKGGVDAMLTSFPASSGATTFYQYAQTSASTEYILEAQERNDGQQAFASNYGDVQEVLGAGDLTYQQVNLAAGLSLSAQMFRFPVTVFAGVRYEWNEIELEYQYAVEQNIETITDSVLLITAEDGDHIVTSDVARTVTLDGFDQFSVQGGFAIDLSDSWAFSVEGSYGATKAVNIASECSFLT